MISAVRSSSLVAEEHLVEHDLVQHLGARGLDLAREPGGMVAAALDQLRDPGAAELADRRVDREPARTARELGRPVHLVARPTLLLVHEVVGVDRDRAAVRLGARAEHDPAVVRHVQELVTICGPAVRALGAVDEVREPRARSRPEPEGAVDVQPGAGGLGRVGDLAERVERSGVHLARLRADDRRAVVARERLAERVRAHPALVVGGDPGHRAGAEADEPQRAGERGMRLLAREHADLRRAGQALLLDVPAHPVQHVVARRGERGRVRHLRSGHEGERLHAREPEQVGEPGARRLLGDGRGRAGDVEAGVLVPGRGQPVGGERSGHRAADHEPEVARRPGSRPLPRCRRRPAQPRPRADRSGRRAPARPSAPAAPPGRPAASRAARAATRGSRRRGRLSPGAACA